MTPVDPAQWVNIVVGIPVVGALVVLILLRKIVPGWALDDLRTAHEQHVAELKASHDRELASANRHLAEARKDLEAAAVELRQTTPVLVRANDSLAATQRLLEELLRRGALRG